MGFVLVVFPLKCGFIIVQIILEILMASLEETKLSGIMKKLNRNHFIVYIMIKSKLLLGI